MRPARQHREQARLALAVDLEGAEVARVDADDGCLQRHRAVQLALVVRLDEGLHLEVLGGLDEVAREVVGDEPEQHEDRVRAVHPGLGDLPHVDEEVLAQERHVDDLPHGRQVGVAAAEVASAREHRDRRRPALGVALRNGRGIGGRRDLALRGRGALDLGDERAAPFSSSAAASERVWRRSCSRSRVHLPMSSR